jgi:hypothetical protein
MFDVIFKFYGLDWLGFFSGLSGMYLITQRIPSGYILSGLASLCGMVVASLAGQYGYITYNALFLCLMMKGYYGWTLPKIVIPGKISALRQREPS